jgi:hypothetical protein
VRLLVELLKRLREPTVQVLGLDLQSVLEEVIR